MSVPAAEPYLLDLRFTSQLAAIPPPTAKRIPTAPKMPIWNAVIMRDGDETDDRLELAENPGLRDVDRVPA